MCHVLWWHLDLLIDSVPSMLQLFYTNRFKEGEVPAPNESG
ncbi:hypothetical protein WN944_027805 [Citrus x changshan-huyou]|uniref:Uncharacterized protein n=1 Tax=Citrus x changshan-huyou TaxID=2935761 RepID=A0AAP0LIM0_9ROSI